MKFKKTLSGLLAFVILISTAVSAASTASADEAETEYLAENSQDYGLCDDVADGTILHAFCWSFNTIRENMEDIANSGFTAVQTSPANKCKDTFPTMKIMGNDPVDGTDGAWWWHYQPTDWKIGNYQLGTAEDYKAMCEEADKYGVKIITDVLPNHTTSDESQVTEDLFNAAGGRDKLFHANGRKKITNYSNRDQCVNYSLSGLIDVNTENPAFQEYFLNYCNELIALGCDGFRYDTAKHIGVLSDPLDPATVENGWTNNFWEVASGRESVNGVTLSKPDELFIYGEILQGGGIPYDTYSKYMRMTASDYGVALRNAVKNKDFSISTIQNWRHKLSSDNLVTWVESHDTYCNQNESAWMTDWQVRMCWAVIAARAGGTPLFLSRPDGSDGANGNYWGNNVLGAKGNDEFKNEEVAAVNKFRNAMSGEEEYLRNVNNNTQILQIDRGTEGSCIINLSDSSYDINTPTTMADGEYKDTVSGREFSVAGGILSGHIDAGRIAVIYNDTVKLSAEADAFSFTSDTTDIKLTLKNSANGVGSYETSEGVSGTFTNGSVLTIGSATDAAGTSKDITVTLTALDKSGNEKSKSFVFTKRDPSVALCQYFDNSSYNWTRVYAYVYDDSGDDLIRNAEWPGVQMTFDPDTGYFKYELPEELVNGRIIFNNGSNGAGNQYPGSDIPGLMINGRTNLLSADGTFKRFNAKVPIISATPNTKVFFENTLDITLSVKNAEFGTYTTSENKTGKFTDGQHITIGSETDVSESKKAEITVTLTADCDGTTTTKTYTYTKKDISLSPYIYFDNSAYNWSSVYVYVYDGGANNGTYPGEKMVLDAQTGYYMYKVPANLINGNVIFAESNNLSTANRYPLDQQPGLPLESESKILCANYKWTAYPPSTDSDSDTDTDTGTDTESDTDTSSEDIRYDIKSSNYVYFFNNAGWIGSKIRAYLWTDGSNPAEQNRTWPGVAMTWSEDLHCYYYRYDSSSNFNKIIFNDGSNKTADLDLKPGMVFAVTGSKEVTASTGIKETQFTGSWISPNDILSRTVYLNNTKSWNKFNIYMWNELSDGTTLKNEAWPGQTMHNCGNVSGMGNNIYRLTYYYPRVQGDDGNYQYYDYNKAIFNDGKNQTEDLKLGTYTDNGSSEGHKPIVCDFNSKIWTYFDCNVYPAGKSVDIKFMYYDRKVGESGKPSDIYAKTGITVSQTINSNNIDEAVALALAHFNTVNLFDDYNFYTSQNEYVKEIASLTSERIEGNRNYAAKINPELLAYHTSAFSGKYGDGIGNLKAEGGNWVKYYDSNNRELSPDELAPDLSNVAEVEVWGFNTPKRYTVTLHYPNTYSTGLVSFCGDKLYSSNGENLISYTKYYNQLISGSYTPSVAPGMVTPEGYKFDGWYRFKFKNGQISSYIKISSDANYCYRVTSDIDLYAVYQKKESAQFSPGAGVFANQTDSFTNERGNYNRFNTLMNIYNCAENDSGITDVGIVYVVLPSDTEVDYDNIDLESIKNQLYDTLADKKKSSQITVRLNSGEALNANTYDYEYSVEKGEAALTNKNRVQFVINFKEADVSEGGKYSKLLAFSAFKYNDSWIVSDNCVAYFNGNNNLIYVPNN